MEPGLPGVGAPPFSVTDANGTVGFVEMAGRLGFGVLMTPIIMVLANIAIAKSFCEYHSRRSISFQTHMFMYMANTHATAVLLTQ